MQELPTVPSAYHIVSAPQSLQEYPCYPTVTGSSLDNSQNPLGYVPSNTLTGIAIAVVLAIALTLSFLSLRYRTTWMLALVIGQYCYAIGFGLRFALHSHPDSSGIYIVEYLFIVLPPCAFIAADYILLGRLAAYLACGEYVPLPLNRITRVFVISDISTFLIQAAGGGSTISHNPNVALAGEHIFLAGLSLQLLSFLIFSVIYVRFLYKVYTLRPEIWKDWRALACALAISSIGILVFFTGFQGFLATTEAYFYLLDTLPLVIASATYIPYWPGRFIRNNAEQSTSESNPSVIQPSFPK
ncbi:RTA1-like protein [Pisolithus albus]|nr:RTA1-like protein [Pisolithus albus]